MRQLRLFLLISLTLVSGQLVAQTPPMRAGEWKRAMWQDEAVWVSMNGQGLAAAVSEIRGRLVYFGPQDFSVNLIHVSSSTQNPEKWGGHRVWLGPQIEWPEFWPPPADWETSAPETIRVGADRLLLMMPTANPNYPPVGRAYQWRGKALECVVEWNEIEGATAHFQAVNKIQLPPNAVLTAVGTPTDGARHGFILLPTGQRQRHLHEFTWPPQISGETAALNFRMTGVAEKFGLPPGTITARIGDWLLTIERGEQRGEVLESPDYGYLSQIFVGDRENPFLEVEQLSARLARGETLPAFSLLLSAEKP